MNPRLRKQIRDTLYVLKIQNGQQMELYRLTSSGVDFDTGNLAQVRESKMVRNGIMGPRNLARASQMTAHYLSQLRPFVSVGGPGWDQNTVLFLFDGRDTRDWTFSKGDWIVCNHRRYNVDTVEELGDKDGWAIVTKAAEGELPRRDISVSAGSALNLESETEGEV